MAAFISLKGAIRTKYTFGVKSLFYPYTNGYAQDDLAGVSRCNPPGDQKVRARASWVSNYAYRQPDECYPAVRLLPDVDHWPHLQP
jgi:hypothetical protein